MPRIFMFRPIRPDSGYILSETAVEGGEWELFQRGGIPEGLEERKDMYALPREKLLNFDGGPQALAAWEAGDDSILNREDRTDRLAISLEDAGQLAMRSECLETRALIATNPQLADLVAFLNKHECKERACIDLREENDDSRGRLMAVEA